MAKGQPTGLGSKKLYQRWFHCGRPELTAWKAAGCPTSREWKKRAGTSSTSPAKAQERPAKDRAPKPNIAPIPLPASGEELFPDTGIQTVVLDEPVQRFGLTMIGRHLSLIHPDGRVLFQCPVPTAKAG